MSLLTHIQTQVAARLAAQAFFSDAGAESPRPVPVLTEQIGDLAARVRHSLGQLGAVCTVLTPTARMTGGDRPRPFFDEVSVIVRTEENVLLNRSGTGTGQPASLVAEAAAWHLHGFVPEGAGGTLALQAIRLAADPRLLVYETVFVLQVAMREEPQRSAAGKPQA